MVLPSRIQDEVLEVSGSPDREVWHCSSFPLRPARVDGLAARPKSRRHSRLIYLGRNRLIEHPIPNQDHTLLGTQIEPAIIHWTLLHRNDRLYRAGPRVKELL